MGRGRSRIYSASLPTTDSSFGCLQDDGWILKGSTALLARHIAVRHTIDVDVYRAVSRDQAERDLRSALILDGGDWFTFEAGPGRAIADGASGTRIPINARLGTTTWSKFHVDVVAEGVAMTGQPEEVTALTDITMPGLPQPTYRAYPLHDHIADKVCAILERQGEAQRPSTRFKDLVDLVTLVAHARPTADVQLRRSNPKPDAAGFAFRHDSTFRTGRFGRLALPQRPNEHFFPMLVL